MSSDITISSVLGRGGRGLRTRHEHSNILVRAGKARRGLVADRDFAKLRLNETGYPCRLLASMRGSFKVTVWPWSHEENAWVSDERLIGDRQ